MLAFGIVIKKYTDFGLIQRRRTMPKDLTVILQERPGTLADMAELLEKEGINIEGICGTKFQGGGFIHVLVEDANGARRVLEANELKISKEREVLIRDIEDKPGALAKLTRQLANAEVNIEVIYLSTKTRVVIGVDKIEKARSLL
jgi:hypothetical protein